MDIKLEKEDIEICIYLLVNKYKVPSSIIKNMLLGDRVSSNRSSDIQVLTKTLLAERGVNLFTGSNKEVRELKRHLLKQIPENVLTHLYNKNPAKNRVISSPSYMITPLVKKKWSVGGAWPRDFVETLGFPHKLSGLNGPPKKIPDSESSINSQPKSQKHYQSCSNCKNAIIDMFRAIYGTVKIEHKMKIKRELKTIKMKITTKIF